jgi:rSAM/selenodomain-associated transferase 1
MKPVENLTSRISSGATHHCALGIMAKAPLAGSVKTRLTPPLTYKEASLLSACFLRDTANNIQSLGAAQRANGVIVYTPATASNVFNGLVPAGFQLLAQRGQSLGDRLLNATRDLLAYGHNSACLINSDSPTLPPAILASAIEALEPAGDRLVLGPAEDGGYYLIGLKSAHQILFDRIAWSTSEVLAHTIERARQISLEVVMLPRWYDVDDAATLDRLCTELFLSDRSRNGHSIYAAPFTRDYLAHLLERDQSKRIWPSYERRD